MSEDVYQTTHIEPRIRQLETLINRSGAYPSAQIEEHSRLLDTLARIRLAQRLGIHPDMLLRGTR